VQLKYIKQISIFFLLLFSASVVFSKPLPSLSVKMKWQGVLTQEIPMTLTLSVFSHLTTDDLEISLTLPDGVTLIDGSKKVITSIQRSKPLEQTYTVQISKDATGQIKGEVRINSAGSTSFYAAAGLPVRIELDQKIAPRSAPKENFKRTQRNGEWLREYQLP